MIPNDTATAPIEWEPTPAAPKEEPINLFPTEPPKGSMTPEVAADRAVKTSIASGPDSPSVTDLTEQLQAGLEDDLRAGLAQKEFFRKKQQSQALVSEYFANNSMASSGPEEVAYVEKLSEVEPERLSSIIEKKYAEHRLDLSLASDKSGAVDRVSNNNPQKLDDSVAWATSRIVAKEKAQKYAEDLQAAYDQQGFFRKAADFTKSMVPLWSTVGVTNVAPEGVDSQGAFEKGTILRQQYRQFFSMAPSEQDAFMQELFDKAMSDPSQMQYAMEWFSGVREYSVQQAMLDNVSNTVEVGLELTPLGLVGPLGLKVGTRAVRKLGVSATKAAAKKAVAEEAAKATGKAAEGNAAPAATTLAEGAGKAAGEAPKPPSVDAAAEGTPKPTEVAPDPREEKAAAIFKAVEDSKTPYTQDEIEHIQTHWDEAVVVNGEVFDNGKIKFTNEELDTPLPEYNGTTLGEVLDGSDSSHFRAMMKARLKYGPEAVESSMMKDNSHGYIDPSNGKFVSSDEMYGEVPKKGPEADLVPAAPKIEGGNTTTQYPAPLSVEEVVKLDFVQQNIEDAYRVAHNLGVVGDIERLAAQGKTAAEIAKDLGSRLDRVGEVAVMNGGSPSGEKNNLIRFVRGKLGIPSLDEKAEFKAWQDAYNARSTNAPHITIEVPNPKSGETTKLNIPASDENLVAAQVNATTQDALRPTLDPVETQAALGHSEEAAVTAATEFTVDAKTGLGGAPDVTEDIAALSKRLKNRLTSFLDPFNQIIGTAPLKSMRKEVIGLANRLAPIIRTNVRISKELMDAWKGARSLGVMRISDETWQKAKPIMDNLFRKEFSSASDGILDLQTRYIRESDAGGRRVNGAVYVLGRPDKTYFKTATAAKKYAEDYYGLPAGYFDIAPRGSDGFVVEVTKIMDETNPAFSGLLINTKTKTPVTFMSAFTSYLKGGAATSSEFLAENLKMATHRANALHSAFASAAKEIGILTSKEKDRLEQLMVAMRDVESEDPLTGKITRGKWAQNGVQFEQMYKRAFGELPKDSVVSSYFILRQLHDFDMITRNMVLYTDMARMGIEEFRFGVPIDIEANAAEGLPATRNWGTYDRKILARAVDDVPAGDIDNSILILDIEDKSAVLHSKAKDGTSKIKDYQKKGYRLYQIANPDQSPLEALNDNYIQFVLAKDVERTPLSLEQLPYTEGGHVRTSESFFVKQAKFKTTSNGSKTYRGDATFSGHSSRAEAQKFAKAMEKGRQLMNAGDNAALDAHIAANLPHRDHKEFQALFEPRVDEKGIETEATFDKSVPFGWVEDGQGMNDAAKSHMPELLSHFTGVKDTIDDSTNLFRLLGKKYTGQKDQMLRSIVQGEGDKAWKFEAARHVSPLALFEQSAADLSRLLALNDLKHSAAMHWVEQAAPYLDTPIDQLRQDAWAHFMNPQWKGQYTDVSAVRALNASRVNTLGFMGLAKNPMDSTTDWVRNKVMDWTFSKYGGRKADYVDEHLLPSIKNPITYMRAFAFHTKLGLFNPVQLFLQSQTMFHTFAVTGNLKRVGSALSGLSLSQAARFADKSLLPAFDAKAQKMGWKAGEWLESHNLMKTLKLDMVEGEIGQMDLVESPSLFRSKFGTFLDKGTFFFKESERAVRVNAWHVAFKEFRDKFPTRALDNTAVNEILRRQEVLSVNMTRAGNAWWQRGLLGPTTQFWGYQARVAEQMLGHQLTTAEKLRVAVAYGSLYGVPVSLGAATFMQVPGASSDDIREYALKNGKDINSGMAGLAMNGIPASLIYWATSDENGQNGLLFNVGQRVGPGGLPVLKYLVNGDKSILETLLGASYSIGKDAVKMVFPEDGDILGAMADAPSKSVSNYANVFSTISTVNNTNKLMWALLTSRNMTRNGVDLGEISATSAIVRFMTGLEEQRFQDLFLKMGAMKDLTEYNKEITKEYRRQYQNMLKLPIGSPERDAAIKKARVLLEGLDASTRSKAIWAARQPEKGLDESINKQFDEKVVKPNG